MESKFPRLSPAVFFYHLQYSSSHSVFLILGRPQPTLMHLRTFPCLNAVFPYPAYCGQETHLVAPEASCRAFDVLEETMTWYTRKKTKLRMISWIPLTPEKPGRWFSRRPPFPWSNSPCRLRSFFCKICCQMGGTPHAIAIKTRQGGLPMCLAWCNLSNHLATPMTHFQPQPMSNVLIEYPMDQTALYCPLKGPKQAGFPCSIQASVKLFSQEYTFVYFNTKMQDDWESHSYNLGRS